MRKALDRQDIRLATKNKKPQYENDWPSVKEKRKVNQLLIQYQEWGARTGTRIGNKWRVKIDLDFWPGEKSQKIPSAVSKYLEKCFLFLVKWLKVSWTKTKKGVQIEAWLDELPANQTIYFFDKWERRWNIGSILALGRQNQEADSLNKEFQPNGKLAWQAKNFSIIVSLLQKFFFNRLVIGSNQAKVNKARETYQKISRNSNEKIFIKFARILNIRQETNNLFKVFYQPLGKKRRWFLLDTYQKHRIPVLDELSAGSVHSFILNQGNPCQFFYGFT